MSASSMANAEPGSQLKCQNEPDKDEELDSNSGGEKDGEVQSHSRNSDSQDENDGEMQTDWSPQNKAQEELESDLNSQEDGNMQCDSNSQEKEVEDEEMDSNVNIDDGTSVLNGTPMENIMQAVPKACTSSTTKQSDSTTAKFEGYDVWRDLVSTLQKIWEKHGNIVENSIIRSGDIVGRSLESLATMGRILEDNTARSLSSSQADYLTYTLSDLKCIRFKVWWLTPYVEEAIELYQCKSLLDSMKNLKQSSAQMKERRAILFEELSELGMEENKLKEKMADISKKIPFSGQVTLEQPLGIGLA